MAKTLTNPPNLSDQIAAILRQEILADFKPGSRLPPIMELAKRFGASYETVRSGLRLLVQEGVVDQRTGSGTYVADLTKGQHVGVLIEQDISNPHASDFYRRVPQQIVRFLRHHDVPARLYTGHVPVGDHARSLTCTEFLEAVERHQLSGVVAIATGPAIGQSLDRLRRHQVPVVGQEECCDQRITWDKAVLARMGTEYLLRHGRRRIALMDYRSRTENTIVGEAFRSAMTAAGAQADPHWTRHSLHPCAPAAGWEEFRAIWVSRKEKPDGLLICDDNLFPGAAMAVLQLGIHVPEDLLVVTHWNKGSHMAIPFPVAKLETDPDACAGLIAEALLKLMRRQTPGKPDVALPIDLVEPDLGARVSPPAMVGRGDTATRGRDEHDEPPRRQERQENELVMSESA